MYLSSSSVNLMRVFFSSVDPTRLLLTFNVSVNLGDKYHKNTALHWAVLAGNTTVISLLLEAGANVDAQNIKVNTQSFIYCGWFEAEVALPLENSLLLWVWWDMEMEQKLCH